MTTKYPYAPNRKRKLLTDEVHRPKIGHDWIVRRPLWVCRACNMKVDGSIVGSRKVLFSECPCGPKSEAL